VPREEAEDRPCEAVDVADPVPAAAEDEEAELDMVEEGVLDEADNEALDAALLSVFASSRFAPHWGYS
jgi:hypothetical protein